MSNRNEQDGYRLFATEIYCELEKRNKDGVIATKIDLREKEAFWESPLDAGRKYSASVREFLDCCYDDRMVTIDLQYAYGEYLMGAHLDQVVDMIVDGIAVAVKSDEKNQAYARDCQEIDFDR